MKIFVGYDSKQKKAFDVCVKSIQHHSSIEIVPLIKEELEVKSLYWGSKQGSTDFAFTRFLVPYLNNYEGHAIFCDSDFIWNCDPNELHQYIEGNKAVYVVKHNITLNQVPLVKMDNQQQFWYPRKNWSSLMLFDCSHERCKHLTPTTVSQSTGQFLHEFCWVEDFLIGELPKTYNYLVGYYDDIALPKGIHFTSGGPWYEQYKDVEFSEVWRQYYNV